MITFGLMAVMVLANGGEETFSPPPIVPAPVRWVTGPRHRSRVRGSIAASGMGGIALQQVYGGGGFTAELASVRNDDFSIGALVSVATTFVTQSMLSASFFLSHVLGERFILGAGPTLFGAWTIPTGAAFGSLGAPLSANFGGTVRGEVALLSRAEGETRREGLSFSIFFTAAAPIIGVRGQLPIIGATLIGGAGIGWTWW